MRDFQLFSFATGQIMDLKGVLFNIGVLFVVKLMWVTLIDFGWPIFVIFSDIRRANSAILLIKITCVV